MKKQSGKRKESNKEGTGLQKAREGVFIFCAIISVLGLAGGIALHKDTFFTIVGIAVVIISILVSACLSGLHCKKLEVEKLKRGYIVKFVVFLVWAVIGSLVYGESMALYINSEKNRILNVICAVAMVFPVLWLMFDLTNVPETVSGDQQAVQNDENNK